MAVENLYSKTTQQPSNCYTKRNRNAKEQIEINICDLNIKKLLVLLF